LVQPFAKEIPNTVCFWNWGFCGVCYFAGMIPALKPVLDKTVQALRERLGTNLYSCCVYGSAVRGNFIEGVSDINLLIVLNLSDPAAHELVGRVIGGEERVDPFILGRAGFERSARAFASKFSSIKRNYEVLHGADPLASVTIDPSLERFLCEQALRNLRLRMVYAFVTRSRNKAYGRFLLRSVTPFFVQASEVLRLEGITVPKDLEGRVPLIEKQFNIDAEVLRDLLRLKQNPKGIEKDGEERWHGRVFPVLDAVVNWVESNWRSK
jgi:predicted nucleotidyltransferase